MHSALNINRELKFRMIRRVRHVTDMREMRNAYRMLVGKPEG
jgi:hypothetical protein